MDVKTLVGNLLLLGAIAFLIGLFFLKGQLEPLRWQFLGNGAVFSIAGFFFKHKL